MPEGGLMPKKERALFEKWAKNNFAELSKSSVRTEPKTYEFNPPTIMPINIEKEGFDFFTEMMGHWVGSMNLMGDHIEWFAFDYRPISPSHIHGIFEGGSIGNLLTSFFVCNFKGTKTIMARNGGILNGIYRTSYFILDKVEIDDKESYYRFVDAYGGKDIMWMELRFKSDNLEFNSYTSRFGTYPIPKRHMHFKAKKMNIELAKTAAEKVGYPKNVTEREFPNGLPIPNWGKEYPVVTSASYIWNDLSQDITTLGKWAQDPYRIDEIPYLSKLNLIVERSKIIENKKLLVYFSKLPLTNNDGYLNMEYGYIKWSDMNSVLLFSEIGRDKNDFTFTYLHPGDYYITIIADLDEDQVPSSGDITGKSIHINILPNTNQDIMITNIDKVN